MNNREFSKHLEQRTKRFAISIIKLSASLPNTPEARIVRNQITKSGTSIGANYREANKGRSRADFLNKIKISEGEASETCFWLEIIEEMQWKEIDKLKPIIVESNEILAIFSSISKNTKSNTS